MDTVELTRLARLVRWQRITISVLLWALAAVALPYSLQNKSAQAALVPSLPSADQTARTARIVRSEAGRAALASLEERMTRYERKYGADEPAIRGVGVALGPGVPR